MQIPQSPVSEQLTKLANKLNKQASMSSTKDEKDGIEQAVYYAIEKRFCEREYCPPINDYLSLLIKDVENAKWEQSEVCYANSAASSTFKNIKLLLVQLMVNENNGK